MEKKSKLIKIIFSIIFAVLILGTFAYMLFQNLEQPRQSDFEKPYLTYGMIILCFVLSLVFTRKSEKQIYITLLLALNVASMFFLLYSNLTEQNKLIGLAIYCGLEFVYVLYTVALHKSLGMKVVNISVRVALCLLIYFVMPKYFTSHTFTTIEFMALMCLANSLVTLLAMLFKIKTEWLTFLGFLLVFVAEVVTVLQNGGWSLLNVTNANVLDIFNKYDIVFYAYFPGLLLVSLSSVWAKPLMRGDE